MKIAAKNLIELPLRFSLLNDHTQPSTFSKRQDQPLMNTWLHEHNENNNSDYMNVLRYLWSTDLLNPFKKLFFIQDYINIHKKESWRNNINFTYLSDTIC